MSAADPKLVRTLVRLSLDGEGRVSAERVAAVVQALASRPPAHHREVLRAWHRALGRELARSEAVVEHAGELSEEARSRILAELSRHYGRSLGIRLREQPTLLAGFRARVGDDVWDSSAAGRLERLRAAAALA